MSILNKIGKTTEPQKVVTPRYIDNISKDIVERYEQLELSKEEFEYLFSLIKNATYKGTELEIIYNILAKLQTRYLDRINTP